MTRCWLSAALASWLMLGCVGDRARVSQIESLRQQASQARAANQIDQARAYLRQAIKISPVNSRDERAASADLRRELAGIDVSLGEPFEAEKLYKDALGLLETAPAGSMEAIINLRTQLAGLCYRQGKLREASELYHIVLKLESSSLGGEHPDVLGTLSILGGLELKLGHSHESEALFRRQLVGVQKLAGGEKREVAAVMDNLADAVAKSGRPAEAAELRAKAAQIRRKLCDEC